MSAFNNLFLARHDLVKEMFTAVAEKNLIEWAITEDRQQIKPILNIAGAIKLSPYLVELLADLQYSKNITAIAEVFVAGHILTGPKIFELSQINCEAMEQTDLNITINEYKQPFPTMVIELPESFAKNRIVPCEQGGQFNHGHIIEAEHTPVLIGTYFNSYHKLLICSVYFSSSQAFVTINWDSKPYETLEEWIREQLRGHKFTGSMPMNEAEEETALNAIRIGLNANLMLTEFGCKSRGYKNPSYAEKLKKYIEKDKELKNVEKEKHDTLELKTLPVFYDFEQVINLYDSTASGVNVHPGEHAKPHAHWRRGHHTMQPYGPKNSLRKRIFRKPCLVNGHLLQQGRIITTYKQVAPSERP